MELCLSCCSLPNAAQLVLRYLWDSLSSFPSLWLGGCTQGWLSGLWLVTLCLGVHPSISIVRLIMIGYCCNCLDGQLNYRASAHWQIGVTTMYWLCNWWLCPNTGGHQCTDGCTHFKQGVGTEMRWLGHKHSVIQGHTCFHVTMHSGFRWHLESCGHKHMYWDIYTF